MQMFFKFFLLFSSPESPSFSFTGWFRPCFDAWIIPIALPSAFEAWFPLHSHLHSFVYRNQTKSWPRKRRPTPSPTEASFKRSSSLDRPWSSRDPPSRSPRDSPSTSTPRAPTSVETTSLSTSPSVLMKEKWGLCKLYLHSFLLIISRILFYGITFFDG